MQNPQTNRADDSPDPSESEFQTIADRLTSTLNDQAGDQVTLTSAQHDFTRLIGISRSTGNFGALGNLGDQLLGHFENDPTADSRQMVIIGCSVATTHLMAWLRGFDIAHLHAAFKRVVWLRQRVRPGDENYETTLLLEQNLKHLSGIRDQQTAVLDAALSRPPSMYNSIKDWLNVTSEKTFDEEHARAVVERLDAKVADGDPTAGFDREQVLRRLFQATGSEDDWRAVKKHLIDMVQASKPGISSYILSRLDLVKWLKEARPLTPEAHAATKALLREAVLDLDGSAASRLDAAKQLSDFCLMQDKQDDRWEFVALAGLTAVHAALSAIKQSGPGAELMLDEIQGLATRGAYAAARMGHLDIALMIQETGSGLLTARRLDLLDPRVADEQDTQEADDQLATLGESVANAWSSAWGSTANPITGYEKLAAWSTLAAELERWEATQQNPADDSSADYTMDKRKQIEALSTEIDGTVVYIGTVPGDGFALVVDHHKTPEVIWLRELDESRVYEWLAELDSVFVNPEGDHIEETAAARAVQHVVQGLSDALNGLPSGRLLLIPSGRLSNLPIQAALHLYSTRTVSVAVNARTYEAAFRRSQLRHDGGILAVADPEPCTGKGLYRLPRTRSEAIDLVATHGGCVLTGLDATKESVIEHSSKRWLAVHLAVHGLANQESPYLSKVFLANGPDGRPQELTVGELRAKARLAVLSSCWLGSTGQTLPDESQGFPTALIESGCGGVLAALWPVKDMATKELIKYFYTSWLRDGHTPPQALAEAQRMTRKYFPITAAAAWQFTGCLTKADLRK
jgi:CHAT domain-containing protein